ncbi:tryptophan-associated transmembrane protein [Sanguibacter antarcticus]|uniref:Tryptophan-associated transmembrane protein n=1 Tax=Sanguibacter antarcticus TaxID=372484 RepID=A0A2A9E4Y9_9MICO|nr:tryptophan-associated transmembrane protein [Sanguibacter antarcticus]
MVLLLLVLGAASLASAAPVWLRSSGATALAERVDVTVTGTSAAPGVSAAALVVIAAALALGLVGRVGRWFALAVVWLAGLVAGGSALAVIRSPADAARTAVAEATGIVAPPDTVDVTIFPYLTMVLALALLAAVVREVVAPVDWSRQARRFDSPQKQAGPPDDEQEAWDALTRGTDPT